MAISDSFQWVPGQALTSIGDYSQSMANTDYLNSRTAQQVAETQDYISQSAKNAREAERSASISKNALDKYQTDSLLNFYKNNEGLYQKSIKIGLDAKMASELSKQSDDQINYTANLMNQSINPKTGEISDLGTYESNRQKLASVNPEWAAGLPTADQIQADPTGNMAKQAALHINYTQENRAERIQRMQQATKDQEALKRIGIEQAGANQRLGQQEASSLALENARYEHNKDLLGIKNQSAFDIAKLKTDRGNQTNTIPKVGDFGSIRDNLPELLAGMSQYNDQYNLGLNKEQIQQIGSIVYPMAQSLYIKQAAQANEDKIAGRPYSMPKSVPEMARDLAVQSMSNSDRLQSTMTWYGAHKTQIDMSGDFQEPESSGTIERGGQRQEQPQTQPELNNKQSSIVEEIRGNLPGGQNPRASKNYNMTEILKSGRVQRPYGKNTGSLGDQVKDNFNEGQIKLINDPDFWKLPKQDQYKLLSMSK